MPAPEDEVQAISPEGGAKQMAKSMEKYECMYVLNPNLTEEETQ